MWRSEVGRRLPPNHPLVIVVVVVIVVYPAVYQINHINQQTRQIFVSAQASLSLSHCCPLVAVTVTAAISVVRKAAGERVVVVVVVVVVVRSSTHAARISFGAAPAGVRLPARRHRLVPTCLQRLARSVVSSFYWKNRPRLCRRCWRTRSDSFDLKAFVFSVPLHRDVWPLCDVFGSLVWSVSRPIGWKVGPKASACVAAADLCSRCKRLCAIKYLIFLFGSNKGHKKKEKWGRRLRGRLNSVTGLTALFQSL